MKQNTCLIIPTYNNAIFIKSVIDSVLPYSLPVIVVNDGATDDTLEILKQYENLIDIISYPRNCGKGYALKEGFDHAQNLGYTSAITMDSDGQHSAADIPLFINAIRKNPDALIIGSRILKQENMPAGNTFANKFSNFWFAVQTGIKLPDTQTGFRAYPLKKMKGMHPFSKRYEAELELLVRAAWKNIKIIPVKISVSYPENRITHFRKGKDFLRISLLNTFFCILAIVWGYPSIFLRKFAEKFICKK
jgi:glycosyltransferase involved in cell wall biosynthesis